MKGKEFICNHLHRYLCTSVLYAIAGMAVSIYYHFNIHKLLIIFFALLWVIAVRAFDQNKKTPIPYIIVGAVVILAVILLVKNDIQIGKLANTYYHWLWDMALQEENLEIQEGEALAFTFLSLGVVSFLCFPFYLLTGWKLGRYIMGIAGILVAVICLIFKVEVDQTVAAFGFAYEFFCLIEYSFSRQYPDNSARSHEITTFLSPFVIVFLLAVCLLPTSNEPMKYTAIKHVWSQLKECTERIGYHFDNWIHPPTDHEFALTFSGFTEDVILKDSVVENSKVALTLRDLTKRRTNLYLIGNVKNQFTGDGWENTVQTEKELEKYNEYELELYELLNAIVTEYPELKEQNIANSRILDICYQQLSTTTAFYPAKSAAFKALHGLSDIIQKTGNLAFDNLAEYDSEYQVTALELRLGTEDMNEFLMKHSSQPYQWEVKDCEQLNYALSYLLNNNITLTNIDNLEEVLSLRAKSIEENYSKVPEDISSKIKELAYELTKDSSSNYEKLKLLEAYLNTFTYTTHPVQVPEDQEFLDYFLFESQEGYCTYFATAMTILARCIGIPARYVQGYCIPTESQVFQYEITGNQAHAWTEAYLEGVGWIPFEPTPGYSEYLYKAKDIYKSTKIDMSFDYEGYYEQQIQNKQDTITEVTLTKQEGELTRGKTYTFVVVLLICIIAFAALLSIGYVCVRIRYYNVSYEKATKQEKFDILLKRILFLFQKLQLDTSENPTLLQMFTALTGIEQFSNDELTKVADSYQKFCYGDGTLTEEEETRILTFYGKLMDYLRTHQKRFQFFLLTLQMTRLKTV